MEYKILKDDELAHWGILGMKWGVRRYQNKDGSLTTAGKRRRSQLESELKSREAKIKAKEKEKAAYDKLRAKSAELDERERALKGKPKIEQQPRRKTVGEMTDEELRERANRMRLETDYLNAQKNLAALNPPKVSAGKKFVTSLLNDVVAPAAKNAGRAWAEDFMKEKLGLNKKSGLAALEDEWKKLDYKKKIKDLKDGMKEDEIEKLEKKWKKLDYEKKISDLKKGEPSIEDIVKTLDAMSDDDYNKYKRAAGIKYYQEAIKNKGAKPDKGNKKKDDDDD